MRNESHYDKPLICIQSHDTRPYTFKQIYTQVLPASMQFVLYCCHPPFHYIFHLFFSLLDKGDMRPPSNPQGPRLGFCWLFFFSCV